MPQDLDPTASAPSPAPKLPSTSAPSATTSAASASATTPAASASATATASVGGAASPGSATVSRQAIDDASGTVPSKAPAKESGTSFFSATGFDTSTGSGTAGRRTHQKLPDKVIPGSRGSIESGSPARSRGGSPRCRVQDEQDADTIGPPRISVVASAPGDTVVRDLTPELMEEGRSEGDEAVSLMVDDLADAVESVESATIQSAAKTALLSGSVCPPPAPSPSPSLSQVGICYDYGSTDGILHGVRTAHAARDAVTSRTIHEYKHQLHGMQRGGVIHATENHLAGGDHIKSAVYGGLDGIITTFATVTSVAGSGLPHSVILIIGLAHLMADGLAMGLGDMISSQAEADLIKHERAREEWEFDSSRGRDG